jgi:hypothetical protein
VHGATEKQLLLATLVPQPWRFEPGARVGGVFVCFPHGESGPGQAGDQAWAAAFVGEETAVVQAGPARPMSRACWRCVRERR